MIIKEERKLHLLFNGNMFVEDEITQKYSLELTKTTKKIAKIS
jgi:hypothetical protein